MKFVDNRLMRVFITSLLLTFFQPAFAQSTDLKTVVTGANQALSQVNSSTHSPVNQCGSLMHFSTDNCGSRVPASFWNEFKFNFNENNSNRTAVYNAKTCKHHFKQI